MHAHATRVTTIQGPQREGRERGRDTTPPPRPALRLAATLEVLAASVAVMADWLVPSLVLSAMAALSLLVRRASPRTLGFHRPSHPWRLAGQMLGWAVILSVLNIGLLIPITNHVSGQQQDTSDFAALQGNIARLAVFLLLGWTLAAFAEELAFRGYLLTRLTDALGNSRWGVVAALVVSSSLFGVIHTEQGLVGMIIAGADALFFGVLRLWKKTVWAPILAHGFDDTIGFVAFFLFGAIHGLW